MRSVAVPPEAADVAGDAAEGPTALYQSSGVRKAVLLARLTDALQSWWAVLGGMLEGGEEGGEEGEGCLSGCSLALPFADRVIVCLWQGLARGSGDPCLALAPLPTPCTLEPTAARRLLDEWSGATAAAGPDGWDASVVPGMGRPPQPPLAPAQPVPAGQPVQQPRLRLGCPLLPPPQLQPGRWERQSRPLAVGPAARAALRHLLVHVEAEVAALGDRELQQEVDLLHTLTA